MNTRIIVRNCGFSEGDTVVFLGPIAGVEEDGKWRVSRVVSASFVELTYIPPPSMKDTLIYYVCAVLAGATLFCFGYGLYKIFYK